MADTLQDRLVCVGCDRTPEELDEYDPFVLDDQYPSRTAAVLGEEGTLNPLNGHFWCTDCYIRVGMPTGVAP